MLAIKFALVITCKNSSFPIPIICVQGLLEPVSKIERVHTGDVQSVCMRVHACICACMCLFVNMSILVRA